MSSLRQRRKRISVAQLLGNADELAVIVFLSGHKFSGIHREETGSEGPEIDTTETKYFLTRIVGEVGNCVLHKQEVSRNQIVEINL